MFLEVLLIRNRRERDSLSLPNSCLVGTGWVWRSGLEQWQLLLPSQLEGWRKAGAAAAMCQLALSK